MSDIIDNFVLDSQATGLTEHTIQTYSGNVELFLEHYPKPEQITNDADANKMISRPMRSPWYL